MNSKATKREQLTTRAIALYNERAVIFDEFQDLLRIIEKNEEFAAKFIATIERIAKQTSRA